MALLPATWSGFCFCTAAATSWPRRARETGRTRSRERCTASGRQRMCFVVCCLPLARLLLVRAGSTATASAALLATLLQQLIQGWSTREIGEPSATSQGRRGEREEGKNFRLGESKWRRSVRWGGPPRRCSRRERTPTPPRRPARSLPTTQQSAGGRGSAGREQNVGQLEPSSISETGWQLKEGGRRRGRRRRRTRSKEGGRGKEGRKEAV